MSSGTTVYSCNHCIEQYRHDIDVVISLTASGDMIETVSPTL